MGAFANEVRVAFDSRACRQLEVPEWGRTLHIFPMTILQVAKIYAETDQFKRAARIIETRAKNADGSPMFDGYDFETLCSHGVGKYGLSVVSRVATDIMADIPTEESVAKN